MMFLIPNQDEVLMMVPRFPGSLILSRYIHIGSSRLISSLLIILQSAATPEGVDVEDIFLNFASDMIWIKELSILPKPFQSL